MHAQLTVWGRIDHGGLSPLSAPLQRQPEFYRFPDAEFHWFKSSGNQEVDDFLYRGAVQIPLDIPQ